jgi:hypothetical protein
MVNIKYTVFTDCQLICGYDGQRGYTYQTEEDFRKMLDSTHPIVPTLLADHLRNNPDNISLYWNEDIEKALRDGLVSGEEALITHYVPGEKYWWRSMAQLAEPHRLVLPATESSVILDKVRNAPLGTPVLLWRSSNYECCCLAVVAHTEPSIFCTKEVYELLMKKGNYETLPE